MGKNGTFDMGGRQFQFKGYDVLTDFEPFDPEGRTWDKDFALQLLAAKGVLVPIITTLYEGKEYLIDGRNRILHSRLLCVMTDDEFNRIAFEAGVKDQVTRHNFQFISGKMFLDVSPHDQAVWSIILNEQRSDNPIMAWFKMIQFKRQGNWEQVSKMYRLNKARFKKLDALNNLKDPDTWIEAYSEGRVAEGTLFAIAKLGTRQDILLTKIMSTSMKGPMNKVTMSDVREVKSAQITQALSSMPFAMDVPQGGAWDNKRDELFILLNMDDLTVEEGPFTKFADAYTAKAGHIGNFKLFRLVEV